MPLNRHNTKTFHRTLYAGELETVTLYKREDDQKSGKYHKHQLFDCRWSTMQKTGEPIQVDLSSGDARTLHVPRIEMERVGVRYFSALDMFVDAEGRWWQPEAPHTRTVKLFQNHWCVSCVRIDPPNNLIGKVVG